MGCNTIVPLHTFGMALLMSTTVNFAATTEKTVETKTFQFRADGFVTVLGDEGYISVQTWSKNAVELTITKKAWGENRREALKRLEELEVRISYSDNTLEVRLMDREEIREYDFWDIFNPDHWGNRGAVVDFDLMVPGEVNLRLETDEGNVEVLDVNGDLIIDVDEGDVDLKDIEFADIRLSSDEGDVYVQEVRGRAGTLTFHGDEGRFRLKNVECEKVYASSDEGDILVTSASIGNCDLSTDEGEIEVDLDAMNTGRYRLRTDEGDIYIAIPEDADVDLDLETEEGSIRNDFNLDVDATDTGERTRESIGRGRATLEATAVEGDITLNKK